MLAPKESIFKRVDYCLLHSSPDVTYITSQACQDNSSGMPGKIWHVRKYGRTTGLTGQKWPAYMYFLTKPVHKCSDWMYLSNTSEYSIIFTDKNKLCRFLLSNIIKDLFSLTCNFFCHFWRPDQCYYALPVPNPTAHLHSMALVWDKSTLLCKHQGYNIIMLTSIGSTSIKRHMNHFVENIVYDTPSFSI